MDFTDLNKACPKDSYLLPSIDKLVDGASRSEILSMMGADSYYNQVLMHQHDENKTAFIIDYKAYCYKVVSFSLKNARATFKHLLNQVISHPIKRKVSAYVNDILVKSFKNDKHPKDLEETFNTLKQYGMKLNLAKCSFEI